MKGRILNNCKKYWYVIGILVIAFITTGFIVLNKEPDYLVLKNKAIKVELGTKFDNNLETYLNTTKLSSDIKKDVLKNAKISVDKKLKDSDYYSVGNYKVTISYKNQKEVVKYKVVDTTAPKIEGVESIDIVQGTDLSTYEAATGTKLRTDKGVYVAEVISGSSAEKAGVKVGDIITKVEDTDITGMNDLNKKLYTFSKGASTKITVNRGGKAVTINVNF